MTNTALKTPQYKDKKGFETEEQFEQWLASLKPTVITFRDFGQDLQKIWVDSEGEILHANLQTSIWCGRFVNMETLSVGTNIELQDIMKPKWNPMRFIVDTIQHAD
jgi:hypothetical protein